MELSHIAAEHWAEWLTPFKAIKLIQDNGLNEREQAINWLSARAKSHEVPAAAKEAYGLIPRSFHLQQYAILPSAIWRDHLEGKAWTDDFWISGEFEVWEQDLGGEKDLTVYASGIRFFPKAIIDSLEEFGVVMPTADITKNDVKKTASRRGAKRKDWWDQLWLEVIRRILDDSLKPDSQAELQRWLEEYTMNDLDQDVGDSTLKPMASNLFKFLENNRGKIRGKL